MHTFPPSWTAKTRYKHVKTEKLTAKEKNGGQQRALIISRNSRHLGSHCKVCITTMSWNVVSNSISVTKECTLQILLQLYSFFKIQVKCDNLYHSPWPSLNPPQGFVISQILHIPLVAHLTFLMGCGPAHESRGIAPKGMVPGGQ